MEVLRLYAMTTLTAARVHELTELLRPQTGEVVILVFVRVQDGQYLMCAPIGVEWVEALAAMQGAYPALRVRRNDERPTE